jgi:sugar/nucleoside kinase (ribokinase family)
MERVRAAVQTLKGMFAKAGNGQVEVLVTLGRLGSVYFGPGWTGGDGGDGGDGDGEEVRMGTFKLSTADGKAVDTTGAGDCYRGSYVGARYGLGRSVSEAMRWAAAAASLAVEVHGAMPSMPPKEKIEARNACEMAWAE